jgi:hypothetical protein
LIALKGRSPLVSRKYVDVVAAFTQDRLIPVELIWEDGTHYEIDYVYDMRPSPALQAGGQGDRYTVCIHGQKRYLFFERMDDYSTSIPGRWFIEYRS